MNWLCKYDAVILEDNPYGDLRFAGEHIPSIKSMDTEGRVIYSGTFSKVLAPGLRVGYVSGPKEIIQKNYCLQTSCRCPYYYMVTGFMLPFYVRM